MSLGRCPLSISFSRGTPPTESIIGTNRAAGIQRVAGLWKTGEAGVMSVPTGLRLERQVIECVAGLRYRGTSLTRKRNPLGPYRRPMTRVIGGS